MAAKVLAIANQKGGVGKTTTAVTLGSALARAGKKVLLLDLDPHACATLHARIYAQDIGHSLHDLFLAEESQWPELWNKIIRANALAHIDIAPGSIRLAELELDLRERKGKGAILLRGMRHVLPQYDYIVLDCPPHVGILLVNALVAADVLIIPIQTDFLALHGLKLLFDTLGILNKALGKPVFYRAVPTMFDKRTKACNRVLALLQEKMGSSLFSTIIGIDTRFREASAQGCTIYDLDAKSRGALCYECLAKEVMSLW